MFLSLRCKDCENAECGLWRNRETHKVGCTREVTEEQEARYYHYISEVVPFLRMMNKDQEKKEYTEIISFLYEIYDCPLGRKLRYKEEKNE